MKVSAPKKAIEGTIELGDKVRDKITGFTGIAVATSIWLYGCNRIVVQPTELDKDGGKKCTDTFDEFQLEILEKSVVKGANTPAPAEPEKAPRAKTGGPQDDKAAFKRND